MVTRRRFALGTVGLAICAVGVILAVLAPTDGRDAGQVVDRYTLRGTAKVYRDVMQVSDFCFSTGDHADIDYAEQVVVRDETGTIIGLGRLDFGLPLIDGTPAPTPSAGVGEATECAYAFEVPNLPREPFYIVEFGIADHGQFVYSFEELELWQWRITELFFGEFDLTDE